MNIKLYLTENKSVIIGIENVLVDFHTISIPLLKTIPLFGYDIK